MPVGSAGRVPRPSTTSQNPRYVPEGDNGIAIATYLVPQPVHLGGKLGQGEQTGGTIVGGVAHDGSGGIIINGVYHHIGPWNPFLAGLAVYDAAKALPAKSRMQVQRAALQAIGAEAHRLEAHLANQAEL
jgi:hypothetical protein